MRMVDLILKKREGKPLSEEEIRFWIKGLVNGDIPDYQTSAMAMAIVFKGMNKKEVAILTDAMEHSGDTLNLDEIRGFKVDKHSTGGVGDKTSLVLSPMIAACGAKVAKLSGRGLGHTGGTLDKLESIPGLSINIDTRSFINQVNAIGLAIAGQTQFLVPADKKLYALRDVTGTVESIPLIASSIMSKKLAVGTDAITLDVTVGHGAFMKNITQARELAKTMVEIGRSLNRDTVAIISDMNEPLGYAVGNSLEVIEAINSLKGHGPEDLMELCYVFGSEMLVQAGLYENIKDARKALIEVVNNGEAFNKFVHMVKAQHGDIEYILHPEKFETARYIHEITSEEDGFIKEINALTIGVSAMKLGAGRETLEDKIDMASGIVLNYKVGDQVKKGDILCYCHTNKKDVSDILKEVYGAYKFSKEKVDHIQVIKEIFKG